MTFCLVVVSLRGPGQSPVLPFACCVGLLLSVGRCGRCSCWCCFRVRGAQWLVCQDCAGCGTVPFACQWRPVVGVLRLCWFLPGSFDCFCCPRASVNRPSITCLAVFPCAHPTPLPSKKWVSSGGGRVFKGGSLPKTHWGMRLLDKVMIFQWVKPTIQPLWVGYANRPKKQGYVAFSHICGPAWF